MPTCFRTQNLHHDSTNIDVVDTRVTVIAAAVCDQGNQTYKQYFQLENESPAYRCWLFQKVHHTQCQTGSVFGLLDYMFQNSMPANPSQARA